MKRKDIRRGFSLAELLTVIALIAILAAVAIPSVIAYRRSLKLTELDDSARTIYLAAQNNLTALRSAAGDTLDTDAPGRRALDVPSEAVPELTGAALKYVSTNVSGTDVNWLVLPGSVDSGLTEADSCYLVEFDPVSGVVYGVFYTERKAGVGKPLNESAYQQLYTNNCRTRDGRNSFARSDFLVGYYGAEGDLDLTRPDAQKLPKPTLRVENKEELVLTLKATAEDGADTSRVFYSVSAGGKTLVEKGTFNSGAENYVVLDTLKSGYIKDPSHPAYGGWTVGSDFAGWNTGVIPGEDVAVVVSTWYQPADGEGIAALPQSASVTVNSLFKERTEGTVKVSYGRHLQNLGHAQIDPAITAAVLDRSSAAEADLDFAKTTARVGDELEYWAETYGPQAFVPVANPNLRSFDGGSRVGSEVAIRNLNARGESGKDAGLFASLEGARVERVTLVDAVATAPSGRSAGSLVGEAAAGTVVDNCHVYLTKKNGAYPETTKVSGTNAGGLIGWAKNATVQNSFASTVVKGSQNAGGLVGRAGGVTVRTSYAASHVSGPRVAGLVGGGDGVRLNNSYAAGLLVPEAEAGGLCAMAVSSAADCYAACDYRTEADGTYSIAGAAPAGTCQNVFYLTKNGVNNAVSVAGVAAVSSSAAMVKADRLQPLGSAFLEGGSTGVAAYPYNHVTPAQEGGALAAPYPYPTLTVGSGEDRQDLPHYGDWLEATAVSDFLAYYERYTDGEYGFQYPKSDGSATSTLRGEGENTDYGPVVDEGYAVFCHEEPEVTMAGQSVAVTKLEVPYEDAATGESFEIYLLATDLAQKRHSQAPTRTPAVAEDYSGYVELTVNGAKFWYNPDFAKTASLRPVSGTPGSYAIRSVRHFNNMRRYPSTNSLIWQQELDLDGSVYEGYAVGNTYGGLVETTVGGVRRLKLTTGTLVSASADLGNWGGIYDGGGHAVRNVSIQTVTGVGEKSDDQKRNYTGLFGRTINATVRNLTVADCDVVGEKLGSGEAYVGALVAYNEANIQNCHAVNCTVTAASGYAGGLVGIVRDGTVTGSGARAASAGKYDASVVSGGSYAGGFAGYIQSGSVAHCYGAVKVTSQTAGGFVGRAQGSGSVKNSYAGGHTVSGTYPPGDPNLSATKAAGGFAGTWSGVTMENVYTTCSVGVPAGKTADVFATGASAAPAGMAYAGGDVMVGGSAADSATHNVAGVQTRPLTNQSGADRARAVPYDPTLQTVYPHPPVLDAAGQPMIHYGDWYSVRKYVPVKYEWTPEKEPFEQMDTTWVYGKPTAEWNGDELVFHITTLGWGTNLANLFAQSGGHFTVTTDLGYVQAYGVVCDENGNATIYDDVGNVVGTAEAVTSYDEDWNLLRTYEVKLPMGDVPQYMNAVSIGGFKKGDLVSDVANDDPGSASTQPVEPMDPTTREPGQRIVIDGDFSDWEGYPHQMLIHTPGDAGRTGSVIGSAFGDGNMIYLHVINTRTDKRLLDHSGNMTVDITNWGMTAIKSDGSYAWDEWNPPFEWWRYSGQAYRGTDRYQLIKEEWHWETNQSEFICLVDSYLVVREDGSQEMEMLYYLDRAVGQDAASEITRIILSNSSMGGSLTIWRDPPET